MSAVRDFVSESPLLALNMLLMLIHVSAITVTWVLEIELPLWMYFFIPAVQVIVMFVDLRGGE